MDAAAAKEDHVMGIAPRKRTTPGKASANTKKAPTAKELDERLRTAEEDIARLQDRMSKEEYRGEILSRKAKKHLSVIDSTKRSLDDFKESARNHAIGMAVAVILTGAVFLFFSS